MILTLSTVIICQTCHSQFKPYDDSGFQANGCASLVGRDNMIRGYYGSTVLDGELWKFKDDSAQKARQLFYGCTHPEGCIRCTWCEFRINEGPICDVCLTKLIKEDKIELVRQTDLFE
jgi:hypothetical protein